MKTTIELVALQEGYDKKGTYLSIDALRNSLPAFERVPSVERAWLNEASIPSRIMVEVERSEVSEQMIAFNKFGFYAEVEWKPSHNFENGSNEADAYEFQKCMGKTISGKLVCVEVIKFVSVLRAV